ncbi:M57 family metalloprotease [Sporocytophaga myxococcoides]|uniref:M57 family metalloprotease n=1 Tax=Sporocytophaga myxococcoides TaxID=153721 RepID=UPI00041EFE18|nr:M57 family metalloprotease [Sporocytophaga myxococcoides]
MIKKRITYIALMLCLTTGLFSCKKNEGDLSKSDQKKSQVPDDIIASLKSAGYNTRSVIKQDNGYIVEGDIFLTEADIANSSALRTSKTDQYRTTNIITGLPRVITVAVSSSLGSNFVQATDKAIARYNGITLGLTFQRVTSGANITINGFYNVSGILGYAGFPTASGNPYNLINLNTYQFGTGANIDYLATVIQHELGHTIGMRHTDYMDRSYSCGGAYDNEGASTEGAIQVPNTPSAVDPNSFMLACTNGGNRSFNSYDVFGLNALYPKNSDRRPVLSFYSPQGADHYFGMGGMTTNSYWNYENIQFYAHNSQLPGSIPIYVYYSPQGADHYYTTNGNMSLNNYWQNQGVAFYAYNYQAPGTIPIHVYYSAQGADHYYMTSKGLDGQSYWAYQGIAFYAFPK